MVSLSGFRFSKYCCSFPFCPREFIHFIRLTKTTAVDSTFLWPHRSLICVHRSSPVSQSLKSICKFNKKRLVYIYIFVIMPSRARTKRTHNKQQYGENRDKILADRKEAYGVNSESKKMASKIASKQGYDKNPERKKMTSRVAAKQVYDKNPERKKMTSRVAAKQAYDKNPERKKMTSRVAAKQAYDKNPECKKITSRVAAKQAYDKNPERKKMTSRVAAKQAYDKNPAAKKLASKQAYDKNPAAIKVKSKIAYAKHLTARKVAALSRYHSKSDKIKAQRRAKYRNSSHQKKVSSRVWYLKNTKVKTQACMAYYAKHKGIISHTRRNKYYLSPPKSSVKEMYINEVMRELLANRKARNEVLKAFKEQPIAKRLATKISYRVACRIAARRLVHEALKKRKEYASELIKSAKSINAKSIKSRDDFGEGIHRKRSCDPYFYEASYVKDDDDSDVPDRIDPSSQPRDEMPCTSDCKPITDDEVNAIVRLKNAFTLPMLMTAQMNAK